MNLRGEACATPQEGMGRSEQASTDSEAISRTSKEREVKEKSIPRASAVLTARVVHRIPYKERPDALLQLIASQERQLFGSHNGLALNN